MRIEDYIRSNHIIETNGQDVKLIRRCLKYLGYINQYKLANLLRKRKLLDNDKLFNGAVFRKSHYCQHNFKVKVLKNGNSITYWYKELLMDSPTSLYHPIQPPLGIMPHKIWVEIRITGLNDAIKRYKKVNKPYPIQWKRELALLKHLLRPVVSTL